MYELIQTSSRSYYILSPTRIGLWLSNDTEAYVIDSGNSKDAGKRIRKILDQNDWTLKGILNTHSHADHIGGNAYLQQQYGCRAFTSAIEGTFTAYPILEPTSLYAGSPPPELRHKFLMAASSDPSPLSHPEFPGEIEVIPLPGHSFDMVGFRTPDNTVYLGDCVSNEATLEKYGITFLYDVADYLATLEKVAAMEAAMFVPAHADATDNIAPLAELNRRKVLEIADHIVKICETPVIFDDLLRQLFYDYQLQMNHEQHALVGSTVRSYLTWLKQQGRIEDTFEDNRQLWKTV